MESALENYKTLGDEVSQVACRMAIAALDAREVMERTAKYGPKQGVIADGACAFCDMGGAGYSSRGDGFHDDDCGVMKAQAWLAKHGEKSDARNS